MTFGPAAGRATIFIATYAALSAIVYLGRDSYVAAMLPAIGVVADWLLPQGLASAGLGVVEEHGEALIKLDIVLAQPLELAHTRLPAGGHVNTTTLAVYALQQLPLIFGAIAAWPARNIRVRLLRILLGVPAVLFATLVDLPFVLAGLAHDFVIEVGAVNVGSPGFVLYYEFLHAGGRVGIAIAMALAVCLAAVPLRGRVGAHSAIPAVSPARNVPHI